MSGTETLTNPKKSSDASGSMPTTKLRKPYDLADSTSDFRPKDLDALNIWYENDLSYDQISHHDKILPRYNDLLMNDVDRERLLHVENEEGSAEDMNDAQRTLAGYVSRVLIKEMAKAGKRERVTDAFVNYLLGTLRFNMFPLSLEIKPDCFFKVHNKTVSSEADFGVYKRRLFAIVDEDKHIHNVEHSTGWGECQIAGEMLAAAYENNRTINDRYSIQTILAVRVIGTRFTFYRARIPYEYVESLADGFPTKDMIIHRYPPWDGSPGTDNIPCLDYSDPMHRRKILLILTNLRDEVLKGSLIE